MSSSPNAVNDVSSPVRAAVKDKLLPALLMAALGLALLFAAGFAETDVLHNATHDERHAAGFPCH
jgi:cobalt transporter subunit CbtB